MACLAHHYLRERGPIDRTADDRLDQATHAPVCPHARLEAARTGRSPLALVAATAFATASRHWLPINLIRDLALSAPAAFDASVTYESPFDAGAPVPVLAAQAGDSPSFGAASKSIDWPQWQAAMDLEIEGLRRSGTIAAEIPECDLPSWSASRRRASHVIDGLWVLLKKRGADGSVERYKARCVANDTKQRRDLRNKDLPCFSPAVRASTSNPRSPRRAYARSPPALAGVISDAISPRLISKVSRLMKRYATCALLPRIASSIRIRYP